ncbi:MAG: hypothetical protein HQK84_06520 [Nitrospinae bacterium]|nr:hypothetical protein [Nitrospinota bacterium]
MNKIIKKILFSSFFIAIAIFPNKSMAALTVTFPLWNQSVATSGTGTPSTGAYTNVFCFSDIADSITMNFYSSTGANFYSTTSAINANGTTAFLALQETAFITQARAIGAQGTGGTYQYGGLAIVFANSVKSTNSAGCFVNVILPVMSNASFSIPPTQSVAP